MTSIMRKFYLCLFVLLILPLSMYAQDGFGFGDDNFGFSSAPSPSFRVNINGEVSAELTSYLDDFYSGERLRQSSLGDIFSGSLNFEASGSAAQAVINLDLSGSNRAEGPVEINEAYLRAFFGPVTVEGGIRRISWGRADSFGPLDIVNPLDLSDLSRLSNPKSVKISRPMIRFIWNLGSFTRLEGVFLPAFQADRYAITGRWAPSQIRALGQIPGFDQDKLDNLYWDSNNTLEYAQGGLRFTTTINSLDLGFQYYSGRYTRPAMIFLLDITIPSYVPDRIAYNHYHHIGFDLAMVLGGFNLRGEFGANLSSDMDGRDGTVENPSLVWSLGFDRDLFWDINLNLQGSGSLMLFHDRIGDQFTDIESGRNLSSSRITGIISRTFLRDELDVKLTGLWGIEDKDFLVMPSISWSRNDAAIELAMGFFAGNREGELGQYRSNNFIRTTLSYRF